LNFFKDNDTDNWKPTTPITFYYGDADDYVPYFNVVNTVNKMKSLGSTSVKPATLPGKSHTSGLTDYISSTLTEWGNADKSLQVVWVCQPASVRGRLTNLCEASLRPPDHTSLNS
jgi:hypothetical protein